MLRLSPSYINSENVACSSFINRKKHVYYDWESLSKPPEKFTIMAIPMPSGIAIQLAAIPAIDTECGYQIGLSPVSGSTI